jgi:hypothetical protein
MLISYLTYNVFFKLSAIINYDNENENKHTHVLFCVSYCGSNWLIHFILLKICDSHDCEVRCKFSRILDAVQIPMSDL